MGLFSCINNPKPKKQSKTNPRQSVPGHTVMNLNTLAPPNQPFTPPSLIRRLSEVFLGIHEEIQKEVALTPRLIVDVLEEKPVMGLSVTPDDSGPHSEVSQTEASTPPSPALPHETNLEVDSKRASIGYSMSPIEEELNHEEDKIERRRSKVMEAMSSVFTAVKNHFDSPSKKTPTKSFDQRYQERINRRKQIAQKTQEKIHREKMANPVNRMLMLAEHM